MFFTRKPSMMDTFKQLYGAELAKKISDRDNSKIEENIKKAEEKAIEILRKAAENPEKPDFVND